MELENIAVRLRHRRPWEAMDLGHALLRAWAGPVYRTWFATYWLVGVPLLLLLWSWPTWGMLLIWWLKPVADRVLLYVFSRRTFGDETTVREVWRALPGLLKGPGIISGLTWRRLSLARSFLLPVWQLEQQRGEAARQRFKLLSRRWRSYALWLTLFCVHMSTILGVAGMVLLEALVPGGIIEFDNVMEWLSSDRTPLEAFIGNLMFMAAETLVEPIYVASGFALYLNRRSELEGWDIELAFRRLAQRKAAQSNGPGALITLMLAACLMLGTVALPTPAYAAGQATQGTQETPAPPPDATAASDSSDDTPSGCEAEPTTSSTNEDEDEDNADYEPPRPDSPIKKLVKEVLAEPVFGKEAEEMEWRPIEKKEKADDTKPRESPDWIKPYLKAIEFFGETLRALVWIAAILVLAAIAYFVLRYMDARSGGRTSAPPPDFLFGLDLRPASLPDDIAAAARAALARGATIEALSLLYRGALVSLIHRQQIEFQSGDTEQDCLSRVTGRVEDGVGACFASLVQAWRLSAYGRRELPMAGLHALCDEWAQYFGAAAAPAVEKGTP